MANSFPPIIVVYSIPMGGEWGVESLLKKAEMLELHTGAGLVFWLVLVGILSVSYQSSLATGPRFVRLSNMAA